MATFAAVTLERATLWLHIGAGVVALVAGAGALATEKGGPRHRLAGRTYVRSMAVVVATVVPLLAFDPSSFLRQFLVLVAVFSGYFVFSGYRVLSRRRPVDSPGTVDWVAAGFVTAACLALGGWGLFLGIGGAPFGVVMVVFGGIGIAVGVADIREFRTAGNDQWMVEHLTRMFAGYIATVTAVSVVNLADVLSVASWLWPTVVGVPLIWYFQREYGDTGPLARFVGD